METHLLEEGGVLGLLLEAGAHHDGLEACPVDCPQLAVRCRLDCCRPEHNNEEAQMAKQDVPLAVVEDGKLAKELAGDHH